jgi:hypothetical protein
MIIQLNRENIATASTIISHKILNYFNRFLNHTKQQHSHYLANRLLDETYSISAEADYFSS